MSSWQGPTLVGGDFNLIRSRHEKNSGLINQRWTDAYNEWVNQNGG